MSPFVDVHRPGTLTISEREGRVAISITGRLDREIGAQLVELVQTALEARSFIAVNVAGVHRWTWAGLDALGECIELGAEVPDSLATASSTTL